MTDNKKSVDNRATTMKFVTVRSVANRWNVSESTVRRLIEEGDLKGIRIRRAYKIAFDSVLAYETRSSF